MADNYSNRPITLESLNFRLCALEDEYKVKVDKHDQDLYRGNGKPGITTRVLMTEETVSSINRNLAKVVWLGAATLMSVLGFIVEQIVVHGPH